MSNTDGTMSRYEYRRMQQRCVKCNTRDARTMAGKSRCAECAEKASKSSVKYYQNHREHVNDYMLARYRTLRDSGVCPRCGKRQPESGAVWCRYCLATRSKADRVLRESRGAIPNEKIGALGLCWRCRKNPAEDGSGYCSDCLTWWESVRNKGRETRILRDEISDNIPCENADTRG